MGALQRTRASSPQPCKQHLKPLLSRSFHSRLRLFSSPQTPGAAPAPPTTSWPPAWTSTLLTTLMCSSCLPPATLGSRSGAPTARVGGARRAIGCHPPLFAAGAALQPSSRPPPAHLSCPCLPPGDFTVTSPGLAKNALAVGASQTWGDAGPPAANISAVLATASSAAGPVLSFRSALLAVLHGWPARAAWVCAVACCRSRPKLPSSECACPTRTAAGRCRPALAPPQTACWAARRLPWCWPSRSTPASRC